MDEKLIDQTPLVDWLNNWEEADEDTEPYHPRNYTLPYPPYTPILQTARRVNRDRILLNGWGSEVEGVGEAQQSKVHLVGTKVVRYVNGLYVSNFDPTIEYRVGEDRVQESKRGHRGGYYMFLTTDPAVLVKAMYDGHLIDAQPGFYYAVADCIGWGPFNAYDMQGHWMAIKTRDDLSRAKKVSCSILRVTNFHPPFYYDPRYYSR